MSRAPSPSRSLAVHARQGLGPVAVSCPEPIMVLDAPTLLAMADACRRAADPALTLASEVAACLAACPDAGAGFRRSAADLGSFATRLEQAAHHLREWAHDGQTLDALAHRAQGGDLVLVPGPIVVGDHKGPVPGPANDNWLRRGLRALSRSFRRREVA